MQGEISANGLIVGGMIGQRGAPGNGIVSITYKSSSGLEDTYEILYTNGNTEEMVVTNGAEGNGISSITKTSSVGLVDTYTILYTNGSSDTIEVHNGEKGDTGDTGATGATPNLTIGSVTKGDTASATITGTTDDPVLNLVLPKGDKGDKGNPGDTGATGVGIYSVTKTATADLVDTYTILYTNGDTTTFTITNGAKGDTGATGNGISTITKTGTAGLVDTYTITYTNGNTDTFEVTNGADGSVTDVLLDGESVVDNGVAEINGLATQAELDYYKTIYNVLPKVSGNGESITLDNTGESILKLLPKGSTSQYGTEGKQLFDGVLETGIYDGTTGQPVANSSYMRSKNYIAVDESTDYSITSIDISNVNIAVYEYAADYSFNLSNNKIIYAGNTLLTTNSGTKYIKFRPMVENNDLSSRFMVNKGSTAYPYEKYTGGIPSPSPSYPEELHEVSGDNEISVYGENLFDGKIELGSIDADTGALVVNSNRTRSKNFIKVKPNTTYYFKHTGGQYRWIIGYKSDKTGITDGNYDSHPASITMESYYNLSFSFTTSPTTEYIKWYDTSSTDLNEKIMISTSDIAYKNPDFSIYPINLPVENIFDKDNVVDDSYYDTDGTITSSNSYFREDDYTYCYNKKNLTISGCVDAGGNIIFYSENKSFVDYFGFRDRTIEIPNNAYYYRISSRKTNKDTLQLEFRSKANSYTPYGTTPIKMRGLGTNEDCFVKNNGKNLFEEKYKNNVSDLVEGRDLTNTEINLDLTSAVGKTYITTGGYFKAGTYTLTNYSATYLSFNRIAIAGTLCASSSLHLRNSYTWTQEVDGYTYFGFEGDAGESGYTDTPIANELLIMINKGLRSLPYEPYGDGEWYLEGKIGKYTFTGNEVWGVYANSASGLYKAYTQDVRIGRTNSYEQYTYCNYFKLLAGYGESTTQVGYVITKNAFYIAVPTSVANSTNEVQTFINNTKPVCYYILSTPTYTKITDSKLISQLDAIEKALSKDGQTNISQVNNDVPFKIYASALQKISGE